MLSLLLFHFWPSGFSIEILVICWLSQWCYRCGCSMWESVTPKYLASLTSSRICVCPFKEYMFSIGVLDLVMDMELHFPGWNFIPHVSFHSSRWCRSCCNMSQSCCVCMVLYRIQSSANNLVFEATDSGRSFIKMRKSSGPSTDPCGNSTNYW